MAESRQNNTPVEIQEYVAQLKRSKERIVFGIKSTIAKSESIKPSKRLLQVGIATKDLEIALLYCTARVGIARTKNQCQQLQTSVKQAIADGKPQEEIDSLKAKYSNRVLELNNRCKRFNDWSRGTPDPTGGPTYREIAEDIIIQLQSQLVMEMNGAKKRGEDVFPKISDAERDTRFIHYREYEKLYRAFEIAVNARKAQKESIKNGTKVSGEDIKRAKEAVKTAKEQFMNFGRSKSGVVPPSRTIYGEIRVTEHIVLKSRIGSMCKLKNLNGRRRGPLIDADKYEAVDEMVRDAQKIDQKIKDERRSEV